MTNSQIITEDIILESKIHNKPMLVDARFIPSSKPKPVIIFIHGFKGFKDWGCWNIMADQIAQSGFCVIKFNFSHNGTTPEKPLEFGDLEAFSDNTYSLELADLDNLINYLHSKACTVPNIDLSQLYLIGHSRGGGIAIIKSFEDDRIKGLVTWAAVSNLDRGWTDEELTAWKNAGVHHIYNGRTKQNMPMKYKIVEDYYKNENRFNIKISASNLTIPFLIIHGTDDPTVSISEAKKIHKWNDNSELILIEDADHVFDGKHPFNSKELPKNSKLLIDKTLTFLHKTSYNT